MKIILNPQPLHQIKIIFIHILCWFFFAAYELGMSYYLFGKLDPWYIYLVFYLINISLFYLQIRILNYTFNRPTGNLLKGLGMFSVLVIVYLLLQYLAGVALNLPMKKVLPGQSVIFAFIYTKLFRGIYFLMLATFYWAAGFISYYRRQKMIAEHKKLRAEQASARLEISLAQVKNAYLKQQINPHVLFNTLNFIYNSIHKQSEQAAECLMLLADILRFTMISGGSDGKIQIALEKQQVINLYEVNRYRYNSRLYVDLFFEGDFENARIIPLILFTLAENVFKHGELTNQSTPARIRCIIENGCLEFYTWNRIKPVKVFPEHEPVGLQNIRIGLISAMERNMRTELKSFPKVPKNRGIL